MKRNLILSALALTASFFTFASESLIPTISNLTIEGEIHPDSKFRYSLDISNVTDEALSTSFIPVIFTVNKDEQEAEENSNFLIFEFGDGVVQNDYDGTGSYTLIAQGSPLSLQLAVGETGHISELCRLDFETEYSGDAYFALVPYVSADPLAYLPVKVEDAVSTTIIANRFEYLGDSLNMDAENLQFACEICCPTGYFFDYFYVYILDDQSILTRLQSSDAYCLQANAWASEVLSGSLDNAEPGAYYHAILGYETMDGKIYQLDEMYLKMADAVTGVGSVSTASDIRVKTSLGLISIDAPTAISAVEAYAVDGRSFSLNADINGSSATAYLNAVPRGICLVKVTLTDGSVSITKIIR